MSQQIIWNLYKEQENYVVRYCPTCSKKVKFYDSKIRRHNANGKKIFKYAIYKCEKDHTWNKILDRDYSDSEIYNKNNTEEYSNNDGSLEKITLLEYKNKNINKIQIFIKSLNCKYRIDKILGENILDFSRNEIRKKIEEGNILVNELKIKPSYKLAEKDIISIVL